MASLLTSPTPEDQNAAPRRSSDRPVGVVAAAVDGLLVNIAFLTAYQLRYVVQSVDDDFFRDLGDFGGARLLLTACVIAALVAKGAYRVDRVRTFLDQAAAVTSAVTIGFALTIVVGVALRIPYDSRLVLLYAWTFSIATMVAWRAVVRLGRQRLWAQGVGTERVIVVGSGKSARRLMQALAERKHLGYQLVGFVDDGRNRDELMIATQHRVLRARRLGGFHDLGRVAAEKQVDEVVIALPSASHEQIMRIMATCRASAVRFRLVPDLFELAFDQVQINDLNGVPLLSLKHNALSGWDALVKRVVDAVLASLVLLVGAPVLLALALAIKLDSAGPVLFRQTRVGKAGKPFTCYKFRTMCADAEARKIELLHRNEADGPLFKVRDDPRQTRVGRFLRRTSLDELGQVFNVLKGEMSWVGPRPGVPSEVAQYEPWQWQRLLVTPGVTGLWQVSGRSDLTFDEMVLLDLYYAEHWSLWLDLKIVLRTVPAVLSARGAY